MQHQTTSLWTRPCGTKPRPALPNHVLSSLFWDIMQHKVEIHYQCCEKSYQFHFQKQRNPKHKTEHDWINWHNLLFWDLDRHVIFNRSTFWKPPLFLFSGKEAPNLVDPLDWVILNHCIPQEHWRVKICAWEQI